MWRIISGTADVYKRQTQEDIRNLADIVQAVLDTGALCVIGNDEQIKADRAMFGEIKNLYH